jgi:galactose oxidase
MNGNAVMYEPGRILTVGGAPAYENADASRNAYLVDITGPAVTVDELAPMAHPRSFANAVVLPDGGVLVIGGQNMPVPFSDDTSVLTPELWDPATRTFAPLAPMAVPRTYHSVALLLPDGRVFAGGGGLCGSCPTNHFDGQIFTPPYLLDADGSPRPRPTITTAPADATAGSTISVTTEQGVAGFSLVRMGSVTHTVDTDQRRVPLTINGTSGTTSTVALPADRGVLVPGYYMLFALDAAGVPSVSKIVRIS